MLRIQAVSNSKVVAVAIFVSFVFAPSRAKAQQYVLQTGIPNFTTASPVEMGFINLSTGNLHLEIPLYTAQQRAKTPTSVKLVYDSRIWQTENLQPSGLTWQPNNLSSGWRLVRSDSGGTPFLFDNGGSCLGDFQMYTYHLYQRFAWADPMGTMHSFSGILTETTNSNCYDPPDDIPNSAAFADDNSGYYMSVTDYTTMSVYAKDGSLVYIRNVDANGNTFDGTDTLGRIPVTSTVNGNQTTYQVPNSQGTLSSYVATNGSVPYSTNFQQSGVNETSGNLTTLTSLTLPDNSSYSFGYDSYGELNSMTLPTGGQVTFGYSNFLDAYQNMNRWVTSRVSGGGSWTYAPQANSFCQTGQQDCQQQVTVTKPSGDSILYIFRMNGGAWQTSAQYNDHLSGLLASVSQVWTLNQGGLSASQVVATTTTIPVGGGSISRQTESDFDAYSNLTKYKEWSFYTGSPGATPDRETDITYIDDVSYNNANIYDLPSIVTVYNAGAQAAKTQYKYDTTALTCISTQIVQGGGNCSNTVRGNVTEIHRWIDNTNTLPTVYLWYDNTGQVVQQQDTAGNLTQYFYSDNFYNDNGQSPPPATTDPAGQTNAYLTRIHSPIIGDVTFGYYLGSGKLAIATDANGVSTYHHYVDALDRPTLTQVPAAGAWALSTYTSQTQQDTYTGITTSTPSTGCAGCVRISTTLDGLARLSRQSLISDPEGQDNVDHNYDSSGRSYQVSNAYRSTTDATYGLTATLYDGLDRPLQVTRPDGNAITTAYGAAVGSVSQLCPTTTYGIGFPILNTDESGKKRLTWSDGLGRIIETDEPNSSGQLNVNTCYKHDALNNLTQVVQQGETRTYAYDQIGRLISASDPESQTATTSYLSGTNQCSGDPTLPCSTTDARGITTNFSYDALNRLTGKTHSDSTPSVSYFYDQSSYNGLTITNGKGRRTGMSDGTGQTAWSFDAAGNVTAERRTITAVNPSVTKSFSYTYNLDGSIASINYPTGHTLTYSYSNAQRPLSAIDSANGINYATNATYWPTGQLHTLLMGNDHGSAGTTLTQAFNNRLQYSSIAVTNSSQTVFSTSYNYADVNGRNNGRLLSETNNVTSSRTQTYSYDQLNRLASWQNGVAGDSYNFDLFGNLLNKTVTLGTAETLNVTVNSLNHITTGGYGYDAAGDMTNTGSHAFTFDAESRQTTAGTATYQYDGDSLRVYKDDTQTGSNDRLYWRGGGISVLSESDLTGAPQKDLYYFGDKLIAFYNATSGSRYYIHSDWQGSVRAITNSGGTTAWAVDYYPWGLVQNQLVNNLDWRYRWVGQEYDPEVQHYNFPFRYYRPQTGNFMSADPAWGISSDTSNPQSLNRYAYLMGDPVNFLDPLGLGCTQTIEGTENGQQTFTVVQVPCSNPDPGPPSACFMTPFLCWSGTSYSDFLFSFYNGFSAPGSGNGNQQASTQPSSGPTVSAAPPAKPTQESPSGTISRGTVLGCAAAEADAMSLASQARIQGDNAMGKAGQAFLGNAISGAYYLGVTLSHTSNAAEAYTDIALNGARLGLPGGGVASKGVYGVAQDKLLGAAFQNLGRTGAATAADTIAWMKFAYDAATFVYASGDCIAGR